MADRVIVLHDGTIRAQLARGRAHREPDHRRVGRRRARSGRPRDRDGAPRRPPPGGLGRPSLAPAGRSEGGGASTPAAADAVRLRRGLTVGALRARARCCSRRPGRDRRALRPLVVPLALVAFGQTLVMLTRGIDLSVGGVISVSSALLATHLSCDGLARSSPELARRRRARPAIGCLNGADHRASLVSSRSSSRSQPGRSGVGSRSRSCPSKEGRPRRSDLGRARHVLRRAEVRLDRRRPVPALVLARRRGSWIDLIAIGSDENRARLLGVGSGGGRSRSTPSPALLRGARLASGSRRRPPPARRTAATSSSSARSQPWSSAARASSEARAPRRARSWGRSPSC